MDSNANSQNILALDIGATSIGWAILKADSARKPISVLDSGSRIFDAGVDGDLTAIRKGQDKSNAIARREARSVRRRLDRTARRMTKLFNHLTEAGLMVKPAAHVNHSNSDKRESRSARKHRKRIEKAVARDKHLAAYDKDCYRKWVSRLKTESADKKTISGLRKKFPYFLRAKALDEKLEPLEIGRIIYHLAQRRGFESNRKAPTDKEEGQVKEGISELRHKIEESGARTLGEYFSLIDPETDRIRRLWTSRDMYRQEFNLIWESQSRFYPDLLTDELRSLLYEDIFYQRPLKSQKHLIGKCEHEHNRARAPLSCLEFQKFRILQTLNNVLVITPQFQKRDLTEQERNTLIEILSTQGELKWSSAKKKLKLPKGCKFNLEEGSAKGFTGNRTASKIISVIRKDKWLDLSQKERDRMVHYISCIRDPEVLVKCAMKYWDLNEEDARKFSGINLEDGHANISRKAIRKLMPYLEKGVHYATAVKEVYGDALHSDSFDYLPSVDDPEVDAAMQGLRNPAVHRALSELRKVVNAVIRKYGKPEMIRVELARELKQSRDDRKDVTRKNAKNQKLRESARQRIIDKISETGISNPSRNDILKVLLADECEWECPYTGKPISMGSLFNPSQFDIEHIIPFSRCMDNSYMNKTLCWHEENRNVKKEMTPYEAYSSMNKWEEILGRVGKFYKDPMHPKMRRFLMHGKELEEYCDFSSRLLNDTRYISRLATQYLGFLYGPEYRKHIQVSTGQVTAWVRNELDMNSILSDGGEKSRDDHRHHAVDAIAIGIISPGLVKKLSDASKRAYKLYDLFEHIDPPWEGFLSDARNSIDRINVSHMISRSINGPLHEETFYAPRPREGNGTKPEFYILRKLLNKFQKSDIEKIIDDDVRAAVQTALACSAETDPSKLFTDENNLPVITDKNGVVHKIRKARIKVRANPFALGTQDIERHVLHKSNHHVEIVEYTDKKGNLKWEGHVVPQLEAIRRHRAGEPVVKRDHGPGKEFRFSLSSGDLIEIDGDGVLKELKRIRCVSSSKSGYLTVEFVNLNDARKQKEIKANSEWFKKSIDPLRQLHCKKVIITPLGDVRYAND